MKDYTKLENEVDAVADDIWDMASKVWEFAELGFEEVQSSVYEAGMLKKHGFDIVDKGTGGIDTAWVAQWGSGSPVIGILVEFDALPGLGNDTVPTKTPAKSGNTNGHGCGHNLIGSGAIGAAIALKAHMEKERIAGTIKVFGCPAEELLAGKNYMAQAGAFEGLDACLHHHPGPLNAALNFHTTAAMDLTIEWKGTTAHSGQAPWDGRSSVQAAELFLHGVNMMREHILPTARMHYYIADGGHAVNVVPDYAKVVFRYRGPSTDNVLKNIAWVKDIAKGAALATQTKENVKVLTGIYDLLPNMVMADRITEHMNRYFPIEWTQEEQAFAKAIQKEMGKPEDGMTTTVLPTPQAPEAGGSTEVGDVSWNAPTMGAVFAAWPQNISPHQWGCTACHGMSIGHKAVIKAAHVMAAMGLDLMTDSKLMSDAKIEFEKRKGGKVYKSINEAQSPAEGRLDLEHRSHLECVIHSTMEHFGIDEPVS
jgi:aminobenzoyl-glutamate utilization protein B